MRVNPGINILPILEDDGMYKRFVSLYHKPSKRKAPARRSFSLQDLNQTMGPDDLHEATPLLLLSRLNSIITPPQDQYKRVGKVIGKASEIQVNVYRTIGKLIFVYLGMCTMLPWNFLLSVSSFWNYKFRNVSYPTDDTPVPFNTINHSSVFATDFGFEISPTFVPVIKPTEIQLSFPAYVAIASNIPGAVTTLLHSFYGQRVCVTTRMIWATTILLVAFVSLTVLSIPDSDMWQLKFLHAVILLIVLSNVGVNVLQGSMFGVSGRFPPLYAGCVMMGQALGGVVPAVAAIAMVTFDIEPKLLGPACFGAVDVLLVVAFILERWLSKNKFFLYYAEGKDNFISGDTSDHDAEVDKLCYRDLFKRSWMYLLGGWLVYGTTLSIFPGLTSIVESETTSGWTEKYFTPVASVLLFNASDLMGRILATIIQLPGRSKSGKVVYLALVFLRMAMIPLFMLCNAAPTSRSLPVVLNSDVVFCCLVALLGASVGYMGNLSLIQAPKTSDMAESQEAISLFLTGFFVLGQATGSCGSYFIMKSL